MDIGAQHRRQTLKQIAMNNAIHAITREFKGPFGTDVVAGLWNKLMRDMSPSLIFHTFAGNVGNAIIFKLSHGTRHVIDQHEFILMPLQVINYGLDDLPLSEGVGDCGAWLMIFWLYLFPVVLSFLHDLSFN
jgi:hypothetical protein